jgi:predicted TPR repeat methyltransferase
MPRRTFLDEVYDLDGVEATRALYEDWADSYDDEVGGKGYATPGRIAAALAKLLPDTSAAILDFGCGTGMSGRALAQAGFVAIDGCDLSPAMLEKARATGVYRELWRTEGPPDVAPGTYAAITAVGVVSKGAAPPETLDGLAALLAPGGLLAFSFNDHTFEDPRFEARVTALLASGDFRQVVREAGAHLPGIDLGSTIFVLART